ncbi:GvpL/GvpF family gas vesicle protein [Actinophytocola sp. NPDC049390]|uniref:GvpL/GvpF family gas vesicle protein n=1 Tax=Actinophytocola sp. NPDC049390 TaxID=3363894 RepID=UPI003798CB41
MAEAEQGFYVYGIVPADVETEPHARGVGDPPGEVTTIRHGDVAALVSAVATDASLGRPEDLAAHAALLDGAAAAAPVLPIKFGAVLTSADHVTDDLLATHHDEFAAALRELEGKAEYIVRGRYRHEAILKEILAENAELDGLRDDIRDKPEDATRNERIALGEGITNAIAAKRDADTETVRRVLDGLGYMTVVREPTHDEDAVHVACLAETEQEAELEEALGRLVSEWEGRVELRLLGPLAAYDFVVSKAVE